MKVVLLAGGKGTRLAEETDSRPKPMVEIGGRPILWHLMQYYAGFGHREFFVALGYKGSFVKEYFLNYSLVRTPELSIDLRTGEVASAGAAPEDWKLHLIDTGLETMTGGRLGRLRSRLSDATFLVTYGDGLSNVNLEALIDFHRSHGGLATVTAVRPPARFGDLHLEGERVVGFAEKPITTAGWINGGFFVFEPGVFDYIQGDSTVLELEPLTSLAADGQLHAYKHEDFWQPMDTLRDLRVLKGFWETGKAPWVSGTSAARAEA